MRKLSIIIATIALTFGLSQCKKPNLSSLQNSVSNKLVTEIRHVTVTANPNEGSKSDISEIVDGEGKANLLFKWEDGDVLYAYASSDASFSNTEFAGKLNLESGIDSVKGKFTGDISVPDDGYLRFYYFGRGLVTLNDGEYPDNPGNVCLDLASGQDGRLDGYLKSHLVAIADHHIQGPQWIFYSDLKLPYSIVKFDFSFFGETNEDHVVIDYVRNKVVGNVTQRQTSYKGMTVSDGKTELLPLGEGDNPEMIVVNSVSDSCYVALWPGDEIVCRFSSGNRSESRMFNLSQNSYNTSDGKGASVKIVDWVDFGDAGKWARYNLGVGENMGHKNNRGALADDINGVIYSWYGDYYAWGDTRLHYKEGKAQTAGNNPDDWNENMFGFINGTYKHFLRYELSLEIYNKYVKSDDYLTIPEGITPDEKTVLDTLNPDGTSDDAAYSVYGRYWETPNVEDWKDLRKYTVWAYTDHYYNISGLCGFIVYKKAREEDGGKIVKINEEPLRDYNPARNAHIFIPFAGYREETSISSFDVGEYDTAIRDDDVAKRKIIRLVSNNVQFNTNDFRSRGLSIRPKKK